VLWLPEAIMKERKTPDQQTRNATGDGEGEAKGTAKEQKRSFRRGLPSRRESWSRRAQRKLNRRGSDSSLHTGGADRQRSTVCHKSLVIDPDKWILGNLPNDVVSS